MGCPKDTQGDRVSSEGSPTWWQEDSAMVESLRLGLNYLLVVLLSLVAERPPSGAPRRLSLAGGVWTREKLAPCHPLVAA